MTSGLIRQRGFLRTDGQPILSCLQTAIFLLLLQHGIGAQPFHPAARAYDDSLNGAENTTSLVERTATELLRQRRAELFGRPHTVNVLPIAYYDFRTGFNFGFRGVLRAPGRASHLYRISLQILASNRGSHKHKLVVDYPNIRGKGFGFGLRAQWERDLQSRYFGLGNRSTRNDDLITPGRAGFIDEDYYVYNLKRPRLGVFASRVIWSDLTLSAGFGFDHAQPQLKGDSANSLIAGEKPFGFWGGSGQSLLIRLTWDGRDDDVFSTRGILAELSFEPNFASVEVRPDNGSASGVANVTFQRYTFSNSFFVPFGGERLVLANRFAFEVVSGDAPYYALGELAGEQLTRAVGGSSSLRGFKSRRFQDKVKYFALTELRYSFQRLVMFSNTFDLIVVGFLDNGRVWSSTSALAVSGIHTGFGGGFWINWNDGIIMRFDLGKSVEGWQPYLRLSSSF